MFIKCVTICSLFLMNFNIFWWRKFTKYKQKTKQHSMWGWYLNLKNPRFWFCVLIPRKKPSFALLCHACLRQTAPHVWSLGLQTASADLRGSQGKLWQPVWCLLMDVNDLHQPDFLRDKQSFWGLQDIDQLTFHIGWKANAYQIKHTLCHE